MSLVTSKNPNEGLNILGGYEDTFKSTSSYDISFDLSTSWW